MAETSNWQARVIGCGECGAKIAAMFDKKPNFLLRRTEDMYPVRCAIIDTDSAVMNVVKRREWGWHLEEDIHILPVASSAVLTKRILAKNKSVSDDERLRIEQRIDYSKGIGGFPYLGRVSAEEVLLNNTEESKRLVQELAERQFTGGGLLTINSLTGGTGTGFSQVVSSFLLDGLFKARMNLNLSIIPEGSYLPQTYPSTMLFCLYHLLNDEKIDGIILADNDVLRHTYKCRGNYQYNSLLHELIAPIMLSPSGKFSVPNFGAVLDGADIRRALRPKMAVDLPELCSIAFSKKKVPGKWWKLTNTGEVRNKLQEFLRSLVDDACKSTTTGESAKAPSGLAILYGPPEFFRNILDDDHEYYTYIWEYIMKKLSPKYKFATLEFEGMQTVNLTILLSGTTSVKLQKIFDQALMEHGDVLPVEETLGHSIRKLDPEIVEHMMAGEIRTHLLGIESR